ncbi:MAG TPA: substrate-binding domain-containing protein [Candidatus Limnocylindria bacterium]|nr:substrate-binding domain-containing protein [Candidatus Limnocylindria bacterium]
MRLPTRSLAMTLVVATVVVTGCGTTERPQPTDPLAGIYMGVGSATTLDNATLITAAFAKRHPGVKFQLDVTDTETAVVRVSAGDADVDFGFIGRPLRPSEKVIPLTPLGSTGSAFAVNASNKVRSVTKAQLKDLLTGKITDWAQLGGTGAVKILLREATSNTRKGLETYVFGSEKPVYGPTDFTTSATNAASTEMSDALKSLTGSIGMVTLASKTLANPSIRLLEMDGIPATLESLASGSWPVRRAAYLCTSADPARLKPAIKALLEFAKSPEGMQALAGH